MEKIYEYRIYLKNGDEFIVDLIGLTTLITDGVITHIAWKAPESTDQNTYTVLEYVNPHEIVAITRR